MSVCVFVIPTRAAPTTLFTADARRQNSPIISPPFQSLTDPGRGANTNMTPELISGPHLPMTTHDSTAERQRTAPGRKFKSLLGHVCDCCSEKVSRHAHFREAAGGKGRQNVPEIVQPNHVQTLTQRIWYFGQLKADFPVYVFLFR